MRCLIVDDDVPGAARLKKLLERMGHAVLPIASELAALEPLRHGMVDCSFVKRALGGGPIVSHLATSSALVWIGAPERGASHPSLTAPFNKSELLEAIAAALLVRLRDISPAPVDDGGMRLSTQ